ncbi:hypothetical protein HYC85_019564 [Camellia sinensis]|uniref:Uncharacterized protein n=1 Tax=Camellia sinensis TaxID=4442 RepID=A0A7J7GM95_CAMSI|nr:hypothetical protein HYC85_019564 [Camellia sinensis]
MGAKVTIITSLSVHCRIAKTSLTLEGFTFFNDYDDGFKDGDDHEHFRSEFKKHASLAISKLITTSAKEGRPVTCLVYTMFQSWAAEVARDVHIPSVFVWTQAAVVFTVYYYSVNGYGVSAVTAAVAVVTVL